MDVIELTRQLGAAIQADERYTAYDAAKNDADKDDKLQGLISEFNTLREQLGQEVAKDEKDKNKDKVDELNKRIRDIYGDIMANEKMAAYNASKENLDTLVRNINAIIELSLEGEDPLTCDPGSGCTGSCSSCGGCH